MTVLEDLFYQWKGGDSRLDFYVRTKIDWGEMKKILDRKIGMTPKFANKLSAATAKGPKEWMHLWVDHWFAVSTRANFAQPRQGSATHPKVKRSKHAKSINRHLGGTVLRGGGAGTVSDDGRDGGGEELLQG